jgi:anaerobic magnesium-protoporphyrin IX monomethyl ester cyclase
MSIVLFNMLWEMGTLGLLNVVTFLEQQGHPARHVYLTKASSQKETPEELHAILSFVEKSQPILVGFSLMTFNFNRTRRISLELKRHFPHIPIVWGGIHPTFDPEESLKYADYVCVGEGEDAMLELVQAIESGAPTNRIRNIWHQHNGHVYKNEVRPLIQNLDDYPFPVFNWISTFCLDEGRIVRLSHDLYRKYVMYSGTMYDIMASRGCPYSCTYCCNALFRNLYRNKGKYVRYRSVDNVIRELIHAKREFPYINMVNIQDDGFAAASEEYLREFSEKYRTNVGLPLRLRIIPTSLTKNKVKYLSDANTLVAVLGIQSSDRINTEIFNRHVSTETLIDAARMLKMHNIIGQYDLIVRNPYETEEDMIEICRILSRMPKPYKLEMFPLAFFPNTPLRARAIRDAIEVNEADGYETPYGSYPIKYPYLFRLQAVCPYTPRFLVELFIRNRNSHFTRAMFCLYYYFVYEVIDKARAGIMRNTMLVALTKKIIFLPNTLICHLKAIWRRKPSSLR